MLHKIGVMMDRRSDQLLMSELGIGFAQFRILAAVSHSQGLLQKDVAKWLGQTEASVSRQVKLLVSSGLLEVQTGHTDKKQHTLHLTHRGKQLSDQALHILEHHYKSFFKSLHGTDDRRCIEMLNKIHDALEISCNDKNRDTQ